MDRRRRRSSMSAATAPRRLRADPIVAGSSSGTCGEPPQPTAALQGPPAKATLVEAMIASIDRHPAVSFFIMVANGVGPPLVDFC